MGTVKHTPDWNRDPATGTPESHGDSDREGK